MPHRRKADAADLGGQRVGADDQHLSGLRQLLGEQSGGALRAGDDIVGFRGEAQLTQVLGDLLGAAGRIVGHEQDPGFDGGQCLDGAVGGRMPAEHGAIEVEQQAIMLLRKGAHVRRAP